MVKDIRDEPDRAFSLGQSEGREVVLDLQSGQVVELLLRPTGMMQVVLEALTRRGWTHFERPVPQLVVFPLFKERYRFDMALLTDEAAPLVACLASLPMRVPVPRQAEVGELLHRINWNRCEGCFELDYRDGEVRHRVALAPGAAGLTLDAVDGLINATLRGAELHHDVICKVGFGEVTAAVAMEEVAGADY